MRMMEDAIASQFERLPPHSIAAEMCAIGSMLLAGQNQKLFQEIRCLLRDDFFFQADHQILFQTMCRMSDQGTPIDALIVREELENRQLLDDIGGAAYLAEIISSVPSALHGPHYATIVKQKSGLRKLISMSNDVLRRCYAPSESPDLASEICQWVDSQTLDILSTDTGDQVFTLGEVVEEIFQRQELGVEERLKTGQSGLDAMTGGVPIGGFTMVGGRPGMGKSQELKQLILNFAEAGTICGIVSIEESKLKIARNMLSNWSGVENSRIMYGNIGEVEWGDILRAAPNLKALPILINDTASVWSEVSKAVTKLIVKHKCKVIAIDYLQLISDDDSESGRNREQEIAKICSGLKRLFKRFNVAGIAAVQLNRGNEQGQREPELRDLRQSGQLEQDGDLILLLHREDYYHCRDEGFVPSRILKVIVAKNKDGAVGHVNMEFNGDTQSIKDSSPVMGATEDISRYGL